MRPLDPARLPGASPTRTIVVNTAMRRPRRLTVVLIAILTICAVPFLMIAAVARLRGDR